MMLSSFQKKKKRTSLQSKQLGRSKYYTQKVGNTARGSDEFKGDSSFGRRNELGLNLRGIPLFPARYKAMLRYADSFSLTSTAGAVASYVFSCNGLFDPNITGTGHQPVGFDSMMLSYEHYTVIRARAVVTYLNTSGSTAPSASLSIEAGTTPRTVIQEIIEDGLCENTRLYGAAVHGSMATLEIAVDIAKFGGLIKILDNPSYQGTIAANPAEQSLFHVQTWSVAGDTSVVFCEVVIEYEAWFTEPRNLGQSLRTELLSKVYQSEARRMSVMPQRQL